MEKRQKEEAKVDDVSKRIKGGKKGRKKNNKKNSIFLYFQNYNYN